MSIASIQRVVWALLVSCVVLPVAARAQFGPPGSGCTFSTLQDAITHAINNGLPDVYVAIPAGGTLMWMEDVTVAVPAGELVHIVPADSTCTTPATAVRPFHWSGAGSGSAITVVDQGTLTVENTHLRGEDGRAILITANEATVNLVDTWVSDGWADFGGGIAIDACAGLSVDAGSRIYGNNAEVDGGGIWDGPASCELGLVEVRGRIDGNVAGRNGGGIHLDGTRAVFEDNAELSGNSAVGGSGGGAYAIHEARIDLRGAMWTVVPEPGVPIGGLRIVGNSAGHHGGGFALLGSTLGGGPAVVAWNVADKGGGIYLADYVLPGGIGVMGTVELHNALIQGNIGHSSGGGAAVEWVNGGPGAEFTSVADIKACDPAAALPPNRYCAEFRANDAPAGGALFVNNAEVTLQQVALSYNTGNVSAIHADGDVTLDNSLVETEGGTSTTIRVASPGGRLEASNTTFAGTGLRVEFLHGVGILDCTVFGDPGGGGASLVIYPGASVSGVDNAGFGVGAIPPGHPVNWMNPTPLFAPAAPERHRLDPASPAVGHCSSVLPFDLLGAPRLDDPGAFELP